MKDDVMEQLGEAMITARENPKTFQEFGRGYPRNPNFDRGKYFVVFFEEGDCPDV